MPELPPNLAVGTMCHCDKPDKCFDHWEFFVDPVWSEGGGGIVRRGRHLSVDQMRAVADLVTAHTGP